MTFFLLKYFLLGSKIFVRNVLVSERFLGRGSFAIRRSKLLSINAFHVIYRKS